MCNGNGLAVEGRDGNFLGVVGFLTASKDSSFIGFLVLSPLLIDGSGV